MSARRGPLGELPRLSGAARAALTGVGVLAAANGAALVAQAWALSTGLAAVVLRHAGPDGIAVPLAVLLAAIVARSVLAWGIDTVAARAAAGAKEELRARLLDRALTLGPEWIARADRPDRGPAGLTALATKGLDGLDGYFARYLPALVTACVVPLEVGAWILWQDWTSALLIVLTVPLIPLFAWLIGRYTETRTARAADATARLSSHLAELVRALPVLTAFGRAAGQAAAVRRVGAEYRKRTSATLRVAFLSALALELLSTLSVALVAVGIGLRLVDGGIGLDVGLLVLILAPECYLPLRAAGAAHHASADGLEAVRRCAEVLAESADSGADTGFSGGGGDGVVGAAGGRGGGVGAGRGAADGGGAPDSVVVAGFSAGAGNGVVGARAGAGGGVAPEGVRRHLLRTGEPAGAVVVAGLSVARRGAFAPDGLDLVLRPGEITRWSAPSGSGKSSTFGVLLGFVVPAAGSVTVDGVDLSTVDPADWRRRVAWVPQRPAFCGGTVADELALAVADQPGGTPSDAELRAVATDAAAGALLGRRIDELSTGERQRVAVARALLRVRRGARILLLDEPTAHLDSAAAATVLDAVRAAAADGVAVLLAAHHTAESSPEPSPPEPVTVADTGPPPGIPALRGLVDRRTLAGALLGAGALGSGAALTGTAAWLIATAAGHPPILTLSVAVVAVRTFGLSRAVLRYAERLVTHDAAFRLAERLRVGLWRALVRLGPARTLGLRRTDGLQRLVDDTDTVRELAPRVLSPPLVAVLVGAGAVTAQALILPAAGAVLAGALVLAVAGGSVAALAVERRTSTRLADGRRQVAAAVLGLLDAAPDLIAMGAHTDRRRALAAADAELSRLTRRQALAAGTANALVTAVIGAAVLAGTVLGAAAAAAGQLSPVLVPVLALLPMAVAESVTAVPTAAAQAGPLRTAHARLQALLTPADHTATDPTADRTAADRTDSAAPQHSAPEADHRDPRPPAQPEPPPTAAIRLRGVDIAWPGAEPVLRDVDLDVQPGARVAVVGPSGAGKSTLLALLLGFLPVESGVAELPDRVAWCPQEPQLVSTTVRENLRLADPHATDDDLRAALHVAALDTWRDRLDVRVGVGGAALSGGEAQRLALARAVLGARHTGVLVLDEPTAHLDRPTADAVHARLAERYPGHTVLFVTHRAPETLGADLVVTVRDHRVHVQHAAPTAVG